MKRSVEAVREAADDQQMLVGIVLSRIAENQTRTDAAANYISTCIDDSSRMVDAAQRLNETTKNFIV